MNPSPSPSGQRGACALQCCARVRTARGRRPAALLYCRDRAKTSDPSRSRARPVSKPSRPVSKPSKPVSKPSRPACKPSKAASKPSRPACKLRGAPVGKLPCDGTQKRVLLNWKHNSVPFRHVAPQRTRSARGTPRSPSSCPHVQSSHWHGPGPVRTVKALESEC